ncbi:LamG-like jellyroll fold domain-containing protein [Roseibacillus persicicus]|uniref:FecR protein domain-containing protein n=1 Tax=Roseibacillus persicicus TaxID=454148 RepID=A0A918TG69_9BACT|nr:LamG-like jellyroll fold domain-containing protein [Roseibacillus persicicus]GHC44979.1 hypothetical protein GCM10007100_07880 [Roseibacillus persicicus]
MSREKFSQKEVDRLAEKLRDDRVEESDAEEIREIIRNHPAERRRLVEHLYLGAALRETIKTWSGRDEQLSGSDSTSPRWLLGLLFVVGLIGLILILRPFLQTIESSPPQEKSAGLTPKQMAQQELIGIAVISHTSEAVWGSDSSVSRTSIRAGAPIGKGIIELYEGIVQIDFYSGAVLTIEGPARLNLKSPKMARVEYGTLRGHIPSPASGFILRNAHFQVEGVGGEFGLMCQEDGSAKLHILAGNSTYQPHNGPEIELKTGEGLEIAANGESTATAARSDLFPAGQAFDQKSRQRFAEWQNFQRKLMARDDILIGYLFAGDSAWERTVRNRALQGPIDSDGAVVGCEWTEGRWPGKGALSFRNSSNRVRLNVPGEYDSLTLATWVRLDAINSTEVSLLHPETRQTSYIHWTLVQTVTNGLHIHFSETYGKEIGMKDDRELRTHYHCHHNLLRPNGTRMGDWVHFALVYDSEERQVRHYQNGVQLGSRPIEVVHPLHIGIADIGNWPYREWAQGTEFEVRNLDGIIDEFVISKKAWTNEEIHELWETGRP